MKRRLLSVLTLVACLLTGALWARSYWVCDQPTRMTDGRYFAIRSIRGQIAIVSMWPDHAWAVPGLRGWEFRRYRADRSNMFPETFGIDTHSGTDQLLIVTFPHWSLLALFLMLPAIRGWQLLRARKRRKERLCPQCGYDLRATPERCPECGCAMPLVPAVFNPEARLD